MSLRVFLSEAISCRTPEDCFGKKRLAMTTILTLNEYNKYSFAFKCVPAILRAKILYKQSKFLGHRNGTSTKKIFLNFYSVAVPWPAAGQANSVAKFSLACPGARRGSLWRRRRHAVQQARVGLRRSFVG
jgi:hypothetical protein